MNNFRLYSILLEPFNCRRQNVVHLLDIILTWFQDIVHYDRFQINLLWLDPLTCRRIFAPDPCLIFLFLLPTSQKLGGRPSVPPATLVPRSPVKRSVVNQHPAKIAFSISVNLYLKWSTAECRTNQWFYNSTILLLFYFIYLFILHGFSTGSFQDHSLWTQRSSL